MKAVALENSDATATLSPVFLLKNVRQVKEGTTVLDYVDLEVKRGAITALIGPSGAGKTSLLRLLNRLDDPSAGEVYYLSRPITEYPVRELRRKVGFVFQTPVMFPGTVRDNLLQASKLSGNTKTDWEDGVVEVRDLAKVKSSLAARDGDRLSVGQKQSVNIARAMMTSPEVLLMDEPTSALDPETADKLMETIHRLSREKCLTVVMVTHRLSEARRTSDRVIVMEGGRIIESGRTIEGFAGMTNHRGG